MLRGTRTVPGGDRRKTTTQKATPEKTAPPKIMTRERADILQSVNRHRGFLRYTVREPDEQAAQRTTVSALCLGGS